MTNIDQEVYPVIVFALARKVIGLSLQYTLILTNQDFYEKLDDCDWIGAEFAFAIQDCDNGSYPESTGLWTADVKFGLDDEDDPTLIQESPWRLLTSEEADRLAEGLPIEEVIVTGAGAQSRVKRVLLIYDCAACKCTFTRLIRDVILPSQSGVVKSVYAPGTQDHKYSRDRAA